MLTIRQVDSVVQSNLFTTKDWEHERQIEGETILYTVWTNAISPKLYLGVFRVWAGLDGDARCGWLSLPKITPEQEKLRDFFHIEVIVPILVRANKGDSNEITLRLKTTKAEFEKWLMNEYADTMPTFKQKPTIVFETFEFEKQERLKVRIYYSGEQNSPPVADLLKAIAQDFPDLDTPEPTVDIRDRVFAPRKDANGSAAIALNIIDLVLKGEGKELESNFGIPGDLYRHYKMLYDLGGGDLAKGKKIFRARQEFLSPAPTVDAVHPVNIIADSQGGTVTYNRNEQGQTIITGGTVNDGYSFEVSNKGVALKPYDSSHFPADFSALQSIDAVGTESKSPKDKAGVAQANEPQKKKPRYVPKRGSKKFGEYCDRWDIVKSRWKSGRESLESINNYLLANYPDLACPGNNLDTLENTVLAGDNNDLDSLEIT